MMKRRRPTIADNPLDAYMPAAAGHARKTPATAAPTPARGPSKQRFTVHIPGEVIDAVRNATVHLSGPPTRLTVSQFAENAFRHELERLQREHLKGKPFPARAVELVGGRPVGR